MEDPAKTIKVKLSLCVENNSKFVRGRSRSLDSIERYCLAYYHAKKIDPKGSDYELTIPYSSDEDLDRTIYDLCQEISSTADERNCFVEIDVSALDGSERYW